MLIDSYHTETRVGPSAATPRARRPILAPPPSPIETAKKSDYFHSDLELRNTSFDTSFSSQSTNGTAPSMMEDYLGVSDVENLPSPNRYDDLYADTVWMNYDLPMPAQKSPVYPTHRTSMDTYRTSMEMPTTVRHVVTDKWPIKNIGPAANPGKPSPRLRGARSTPKLKLKPMHHDAPDLPVMKRSERESIGRGYGIPSPRSPADLHKALPPAPLNLNLPPPTSPPKRPPPPTPTDKSPKRNRSCSTPGQTPDPNRNSARSNSQPLYRLYPSDLNSRASGSSYNPHKSLNRQIPTPISVASSRINTPTLPSPPPSSSGELFGFNKTPPLPLISPAEKSVFEYDSDDDGTGARPKWHIRSISLGQAKKKKEWSWGKKEGQRVIKEGEEEDAAARGEGGKAAGRPDIVKRRTASDVLLGLVGMKR
jgi:hypothetical protein